MFPSNTQSEIDPRLSAGIALDHRLPQNRCIPPDHCLHGATLGQGNQELPFLGTAMAELEDADGEWVRLLHRAEASHVPVPDPCVFLG